MKVGLFPIYIYHYRVLETPLAKETVLDYYRSSNHRKVPAGWNCDLFTTYGTNDFFIDKVFNFIRPCLDDFINDTNSSGSCRFTEAWLNCYKSKNWQERHNHIPGQWSAIYYVIFNSNEHEGSIFHDPNEENRAFTGELENNITANVQEGDLLIFPSWLQHSAPINNSSELRATISFNFSIGEYE